MQSARRPEATTNTTQKTTMTPASRAGQLFSRLERRAWTAGRAERGMRAAILDCGVERLAGM